MTKDVDAGAKVVAVSHYYNAGTLDDDREMKACLEDGKWHAVSREDPAYKRSLVKSHAKAVQRQAKQLQNDEDE